MASQGNSPSYHEAQPTVPKHAVDVASSSMQNQPHQSIFPMSTQHLQSTNRGVCSFSHQPRRPLVISTITLVDPAIDYSPSPQIAPSLALRPSIPTHPIEPLAIEFPASKPREEKGRPNSPKLKSESRPLPPNSSDFVGAMRQLDEMNEMSSRTLLRQ